MYIYTENGGNPRISTYGHWIKHRSGTRRNLNGERETKNRRVGWSNPGLHQDRYSLEVWKQNILSGSHGSLPKD